MQASRIVGVPGAAALPLPGASGAAALTLDEAADFADAVRLLDDDPGVRVIIIGLRGEADAGGFAASDPRSQPAAAIAAVRTPTIAAVSGDCFDQRLEAALACDVRVADATARFALRCVQHGLLPTDGGAQRLTRIAGRGAALLMLLTGRVVSASGALRAGLVDEVVEQGGLDGTVEGVAVAVAKAAPIAAAYAKEAVHAGADLALAQGLLLEHDLSALLHSTSDRAEGLRAFAEGRAPEFQGR